MHRERDLAVFHPETAGTARVVAGDVIHALAHEFDDEQARTQLLEHGIEVIAALCQARSEREVVRSAGIAGGLHAELARRIAAEKVALHHPALDDRTLDGAHAFVVKRRTALAAHDMRVFHHVDVLGQHTLAQ